LKKEERGFTHSKREGGVQPKEAGKRGTKPTLGKEFRHDLGVS